MNPAMTQSHWTALCGWMALEAAIVVVAAVLMCVALRRPTLQRAVWQAAALGLIGLFLAEVTGYYIDPVAPRTAAMVPNAQSRTEPISSRGEKPPSASRTVFPTEGLVVSEPMAPLGAESRTREWETTSNALPEQKPEPPWWPFQTWLVGCLLVVVWRVAASMALGQTQRRFAPITNGELLQRLEQMRVACSVSQRVRYYTDESMRSPMVYGARRPTLVLPFDFAERFTPAQQSAMLAHEFAHLEGRDALWRWVADAALALWWWHPGAWWARRQLRTTTELAADHASASVANGPAALAESLVILGRQMTHPSGNRGFGVVGGGFHSDLARRVTCLLAMEAVSPSRPESRWIRRGGSLLMILIATTVILGPWPWVSARAQRPTPSRALPGASADPTTDRGSLPAGHANSENQDKRAGPDLAGSVGLRLDGKTLVDWQPDEEVFDGLSLRPRSYVSHRIYAGLRSSTHESSLPGDSNALIADARLFIGNGALAEAYELLALLLEKDPQHTGAQKLKRRLEMVRSDSADPIGAGRSKEQLRQQMETIILPRFEAIGMEPLGFGLRRLLGAAVLSDASDELLKGLHLSTLATINGNHRISPQRILMRLWHGEKQPIAFVAALNQMLREATPRKLRYQLTGDGVVLDFFQEHPPWDFRTAGVILGSEFGVPAFSDEPRPEQPTLEPVFDANWKPSRAHIESKRSSLWNGGAHKPNEELNNPKESLDYVRALVKRERLGWAEPSQLEANANHLDMIQFYLDGVLRLYPDHEEAKKIQSELNALRNSGREEGSNPPTAPRTPLQAPGANIIGEDAKRPELYTRRFKVNPAVFEEGLEPVGGLADLQVRVRNFLVACGIDIPVSSLTASESNPSSYDSHRLQDQQLLFYNNRTGILFARLSLKDLDTLAQALGALEVSSGADSKTEPLAPSTPESRIRRALEEAAFPAQRKKQPDPVPPKEVRSVRLKVEIANIPEHRSEALGLDWLYGDASAPISEVESGQPVGNLPGATSPNAANFRVDRSSERGRVVELSQGQWIAFHEKLKLVGNGTLIQAPEVVVQEGRKGRVAIENSMTMVTGTQTLAPGKHAPQTESLMLGPSIDLKAHWIDNQWQIEMDARVVEFLGYDDPGKPSAGEPLRPLPRLRVREVQGTGKVADGHCLLFRGPMMEIRERKREGRLFKKAVEVVKRERLLILVTPVY